MTKKDLSILLVDDEEKFLDSIAERIRLKGYEPLMARSGQEAVALAEKNKIDVAVVDLRMPDMDGLVTITRLKERQPKIKTVLLTAFGDDKTKEAAEALNTAYFEKQDMKSFWDFLSRPKRKPHVLLVDDEENFLKSTAERVRLKGYEPLQALTGQEAIEIARNIEIDVAVVDLRMPDMDGLVTITKLKELQPKIKTVLLTAFGNEKLKEATEALNSDYFEKQDMGSFWGFMRNFRQKLEDTMAAAGMATGGDLDDAVKIEAGRKAEPEKGDKPAPPPAPEKPDRK
ncbi:MAG: response regulator [Proteobacteria bacterium]|nr:response regulator [Pseudomonadota bacterium]